MKMLKRATIMAALAVCLFAKPQVSTAGLGMNCVWVASTFCESVEGLAHTKCVMDAYKLCKRMNDTFF